MAVRDSGFLVKDASGKTAKPPRGLFPGPGWAVLSGLAAMLLGVAVVILAHALGLESHSWVVWMVEIAGLGLAMGGLAYAHDRYIRRLTADLQNETRERRRAESILRLQRDLAVMLGSARDVQSALERILDIGFLIEGVDCGGIYLTDDDTGGLVLVAHRGLSETFIKANACVPPEDMRLALLKVGKPILFTLDRLKALDRDGMYSAEGLYALASIPLLSEGRIMACLNLASRTRDFFSEGITEVFQVVASLLAGVIERLRSEEALSRSEVRFRTMAEFTRDLEYWVGADGRMMYISPSCETLTGYTRAEFQANPNLPDLIVHPDDRAFLVGHRVGEADRPDCAAEVRIRTRSGQTRWIAHVCVPVRGADGRFLGRRASDRDITDRKQAEQALDQERHLFMSGPVVVFKWRNDEEWSVEYVSTNIGQFGYKPDDFYQGRVRSYDIIHPDDQARTTAEGQLYIQALLPRYEQEYRVVRPDGEARWVHDVTMVVRNDSGAITHFHGYLLDITERKLAEDKMRENERSFRALALENARLLGQARQDAQTKATLLQEVNHRVKNNLSSIIGLLRAEERFARRAEPLDPALRFRDMAERISGLATVHSLLSAAEWGPILLDKLIRHIIYATLRLVPSDRRAQVEVASATVQVGAKQANSLALIFNELAMNAVKYGLRDREHLVVRVAIRTEQAGVALEFRNDGPGFPDPVLKGEGRGMGLYLVETLVRHDLGGELELRNENGPVVAMRLPRAAEGADANG